jgi:HK97 family phage prohead protease
MAVIHKTHITEKVRGNEFVMSDETADRYGDVIECKPDSWDLTDFRKNPVCLFGHNSSFPIGIWERVRVENGALRGHLKMAPLGTSGRIDEISRLIDAGILVATSVGFKPIESRPISNSHGERYVKQALLECSIVSVPANPNALAVAKSLGTSRKTLAISQRTRRSLSERRQVIARARTLLARLKADEPRMLAEMAARRQRELLGEDEVELSGSNWPRYNHWRGENW